MRDLALIELVGPPGAGKSTVLATLDGRDDLRVVPMPILRRPPYRSVLARHLAATALRLARRGALGRGWDRNMIVMTAYLSAIPEVLRGRRRPPCDAVVFDQGALYTLSRPPMLTARMRDLADVELRRWTGLLDVVVWLDAPDAVLAGRIDARGWEHRYRGEDAAAVAAGLAHDRAVYGDLLKRVEAADDGPAVLRFDSSRQGADEIAAAVLAAANRA